MKDITWTIDDSTAHIYCYSERAALRLAEEIQSIDGSRIERDGRFLYAMLNDESGDAAEAELLAAGYHVESI